MSVINSVTFKINTSVCYNEIFNIRIPSSTSKRALRQTYSKLHKLIKHSWIKRYVIGPDRTQDINSIACGMRHTSIINRIMGKNKFDIPAVFLFLSFFFFFFFFFLRHLAPPANVDHCPTRPQKTRARPCKKGTCLARKASQARDFALRSSNIGS